MNRHELKYSCTCRKFSSKTICEINSKAYQLSRLKDPLLYWMVCVEKEGFLAIKDLIMEKETFS